MTSVSISASPTEVNGIVFNAGASAFTITANPPHILSPLTISGVGFTKFYFSSTAGNATFTNNGGAVSVAGGGGVGFLTMSTAGNATLIANSGLGGGTAGSFQFFDGSHGGTARVEVFGNGTGDTTNGNLDISSHNAPGVT